MSFRTIRRLRGLGKEKFDAIKDKLVDGVRELLRELDNEVIFKGRKGEQDQEIFLSMLLSLALPIDYYDRTGKRSG